MAGSSVRQYFQGWAPSYDRSLDEFQYKVPNSIHDLLMPYLAERKGNLDFLDLGIGTGLSSAPFRKSIKDIKITGVDVSSSMLDECRKKGIADKLVNVDLRYKDLPFGAHEFDVVVAAGLLEFIEKPQRVIGEIIRVLRPGGLCVLAHELPQKNRLYRNGIFSGRVEKESTHWTIRRRLKGNWFCYYDKYLHTSKSMQNIFDEGPWKVEKKENMIAYQWSESEKILYAVWVLRNVI